MNWMSALALIDCNTISVEAITNTEEVTPEPNQDQALDHRVVLEESDIESAWDEFIYVGTTNSVGERDLSGFSEPEAEIEEKDEEAYDLLWLEAEMDKYCVSYSSEESDDNLAQTLETKNTHNVARRATKKERRAKRKNPTQVGVYRASMVPSHPTITTETMMEHELSEKVKEDSVGENIDAMQVPNFFKKYLVDEVIIVMPKADRIGMNLEKESPDKDHVYDSVARTKSINLAFDPKEGEKLVYVGEQLQDQEVEDIKELLLSYRDCFAWSYEELKGVSPEVVVHTIPLTEDVIPKAQRPYRTNPNMARIVQEELQKLLDAQFIYEIEHSEWVSPIVCVPKKNGKTRVCVDYKKLNAYTVKDHFPLPFTESILERVAGHEMYSFLDGFSGYNQVQIHQDDQHKTTFATEWGTYAYRVMPFGLTNAPSTFQRLMCHAFKDFLRKFLEIFMDDLCVYSTKGEHIDCLRQVLARCRAYGISLNPLKCQFMVTHGVVLGHVVSRRGIATHDDKVKSYFGLRASIQL